ncbi:hypothetical protein B0T22DRAFT_492582 [Podospora appendiculata]|uniref:Rhomboid family membrane protein n=1 Tax=Podospora appendiculata TaxID=314037 RepID=A0AAE0X664_9PEZI|nr:hypothetical protein B0T22DRAFT_492582 [Podospora appendiculata]
MAPQEQPPPQPAATPSTSYPSSEPQDPATGAGEQKWQGTPPLLHNAAIAVSILGPIALLLPGRGRGKFSVQNTVLSCGSFWALNQLTYDFTGKSINERSSERWASVLSFESLPAKARANQALMEAERERREAELPREVKARLEEARRARDEVKKGQEKGVLGRLWLGGETDDWKAKRLEEEKKALESGKGYGEMIMEQIWDVWNQGDDKKKQGGEGKAEGEKLGSDGKQREEGGEGGDASKA